MARTLSTLTNIINDCELRLEEAKEAQFFGGDALQLNEYDAQLSNDASATYSLTLIPVNRDLGVLPSKCELRWTNTNMNSQAVQNYFCYQVFRNDGVFEWYITGGHANDFDTYLTLQYIGDGTVNLTRVA